MQFAILGPLSVRFRDREVLIERPRWRSVLAYLLLNANRPTSVDQLVAALWGCDPPATARSQLHNTVSAIRRALRRAGAPEVIATQPAGYSISVADDALDATAFARAIAAARELAPVDPAAAVHRLRWALELWRGAALKTSPGRTSKRREPAWRRSGSRRSNGSWIWRSSGATPPMSYRS